MAVILQRRLSPNLRQNAADLTNHASYKMASPNENEKECGGAMALSRFALLAFILSGCTTRPPIPSVAEGRSLYKANGCANCHGPQGHGDGLLTAKLPSKPIDLHYSSLF